MRCKFKSLINQETINKVYIEFKNFPTRIIHFRIVLINSLFINQLNAKIVRNLFMHLQSAQRSEICVFRIVLLPKEITEIIQ